MQQYGRSCWWLLVLWIALLNQQISFVKHGSDCDREYVIQNQHKVAESKRSSLLWLNFSSYPTDHAKKTILDLMVLSTNDCAFVVFHFSIDYPSHNWPWVGAFILYSCLDRLLDKLTNSFESAMVQFLCICYM